MTSEAKYQADPEAASAPPPQKDLKDMGGFHNSSNSALQWSSLMVAVCGLVLGVVALILVVDVRGRI